MNKIYKIHEKDLKIALDQVDNFKDKMEMFSSKHLNYSYNVKFNKELDKWLFKLNIKHEQEDGWLILLNIKTKDGQRNTQTAQQTV